MPDTLDSRQQIELTLRAAKMAQSALQLVGVKDKFTARLTLKMLLAEAIETDAKLLSP